MLKLKSLFILLFSIFASFLFLLPLSQTEANITTGLVSHWKMDETTGTTASDSAGTNTGTLINSPTWTTGKLNNALSFDGINDYTNISNESNFDFERTNSFSASAWIKIAPTTVENSILGKEFNGPTYTGWAFYVEPDSVRVFLVNKWDAPSNGIVKNSSIQVDDNLWHHVAFTYNGTSLASGINIYIDGVLSNGTVTRDNLSASMLNNVPLNIGSSVSGSANYFKGVLDEIRVYNRVLSSSDITELYNYTGSGGSSSQTPSSSSAASSIGASSSSQTQSSSSSSVQLAPTVTTNSATSIAQTSATLNATI